MSVQRLRILMLPGYSQNAAIFAEQMATIRADLGEHVEMHFVDQPLIVDASSPGLAHLSRFNSSASLDANDKNLPRAFWSGRREGDWVHYDFLNETIAFFRELLERERFDGVIGFSQGGAMAAILTALCERPAEHPVWAAPPLPGREAYPWPPAPFKFCIIGSGFKPVEPSLRKLYEPEPSTVGATPLKPIRTPTLLIIGEKDPIIPRDRSEVLARHHRNIRIVYHDGGHYMPSKPSWRRFYREYVDSFRAGGSCGGLDIAAPFRAESHEGVERRSEPAGTLPTPARL